MLKQDYELTRDDIQLLSSRDALAALFAKLGYDTNDRLIQNVAAMGFTSDNLKSAITHIERLASQDARMFEVYLFELKSVTIATTQGIVRAFRNRPGDYLLVLTDDYNRLDFVLVQRYSSESPKPQETIGLPPTSKQVGVRPRILTVSRRNPDDVALRVLRRFSYTESDTIAQYEKLLSAYDVADWSEPFFNNRALFSDYYLTTRLPDSPEWKNAVEAGAMTRAFRHLRELYADVRETFSNQPEEVIRAKLLEPTLTTLGFVIKPIKIKNTNTVDPDYKLYAAPKPPQTNRNIVGTPLAGVLNEPIAPDEPVAQDKPLALCLAYTWGRSLDGKDEQRDSQTPDENPGAVVVTLLDSGEADWAIVTNGKIWRLYSAKAHSRATNYYEIDLEETLSQSPAHLEYAFRYFWLFFRSAAFIPAERFVGGEKRLLCFLDSLMNESERYARELGERLKDRVFFEIFPHFARGFIIYARRAGQLPANLDSLDAAERNPLLEPFFSATLTFLYRLLFLLYAESRDLLPVREVRGYHEKSLERLKKQVAEKAGTIEDQAPGKLKAAYTDLSTAFYDRLQELFDAVDKGDAALNVPVYNGGLFMTQPDPADTSPEADVARFLANCKIPDRALALGLDLMARDMDEKRHDLAFIDYKSLGVRQLGSIYEGLLEFKLRVAPEEMAVVKGKKTEEIVPYTEAKQKKLPILKEGRGKDAYDKTYSRGRVYLENDRRERKATGSYFTPDYIVKYIVEHTVGPVITEKLETLRPIFREAEKTLKAERDKVKALGRKDISPENETYKKFRQTLNEAFFDLKVLDPAMGSGHFLVEAVDYITDQMAKILTAFKWSPVVHELAQTRHEIQQEMDRQGVTIDMSKLTDLNLLKRRVLKSCIYGVDLNPMAVELAKVSLWLDCFTLGAPLSFLDHHMKCGNSHALAPFKRLLDVWISEYFGNKGAKHTTQERADAIVADNYSKANQVDKKAIKTALELAQTKRFFHWELEFPEVFYDAEKRKENGGFDAVVGNPPYDELSEDARGSEIDEMPYLHATSHMIPALGHRINLYRLFIAEALGVLRVGGWHGFIVPLSLLADQFTLNLRKYLLETIQIKVIEQFPQKDDPRDRVFPDAKLSTCLYVIHREALKGNQVYVRTHPGRYIQKESPSYVTSQGNFCKFDQDNLSIPGLSQQAWDIVLSLSTSNRISKMADYAKALPGELMINRQFDPYLTDADQGEEIIRGSHIGMYELIEPKQGEPLYLLREKYISEHANSIKAFHYQRERVVYQRYAAIDNFRRLIAIILPPNYFCSHTVGYLADVKECKLSFLVSLLNSILLDWRFNLTSTNNNINGYEIESLPIPRIKFTTSPKQRSYYLEKAKHLYEYCLDKNDQVCVLGFVNHHLSKEPEESDVVHDLLAFLAEEMIRLNKEKRVLQREFLNWLVTTLKVLPDKEGRQGIDVVTNKAKLTDYPGDYQKNEPFLTTEELLGILRNNKNHLGVSLSDVSLVDRIKKTYEESLQMVLPLKERLARTDRLIDQVVYRLYGLTEEEIKVVEGR